MTIGFALGSFSTDRITGLKVLARSIAPGNVWRSLQQNGVNYSPPAGKRFIVTLIYATVISGEGAGLFKIGQSPTADTAPATDLTSFFTVNQSETRIYPVFIPIDNGNFVNVNNPALATTNIHITAFGVEL